LTGVDLDSFTDALSRIAPDEPLAHLSNVEISSRQRAAGGPGEPASNVTRSRS
jgi:hypothetical protein